MADAIRWGILGASKFAREHMGPAIHAAEHAVLAAVATSDPGKAAGFAAFAPGLRVHAGYEALLADPGIDAVYVPLPNSLHVEWTRRALEAGKHVLTEKPVAMRADEIDGLIALRDATGLCCAEAYMIVHHPQWIRARALVAEGAIGAVRHVTGVFTYDNPDPANIRNRPETGGGSIRDIGVYTIGSTRWVTGQEPVEIELADLRLENGVEVTGRVAARFPGFTADWLTSMRLYPRQEMTFHGETGAIRLTTPFNARVAGEARVEIRRAGGAECVERFPRDAQYVLQVEAFGRWIRDGGAYPWRLEDAKGTQAVIDAIHARAGLA